MRLNRKVNILEEGMLIAKTCAYNQGAYNQGAYNQGAYNQGAFVLEVLGTISACR